LPLTEIASRIYSNYSEEVKMAEEDTTKEIAQRLGSAFSVVAHQFMPAVTEALERSDKEISFGATVRLKKVRGVIVGRMKPHEPKIPTDELDEIHFVLRPEPNGQLSFLYPGTLKEMELEIANRDVKPEDDGYTPGDNS